MNLKYCPQTIILFTQSLISARGKHTKAVIWLCQNRVTIWINKWFLYRSFHLKLGQEFWRVLLTLTLLPIPKWGFPTEWSWCPCCHGYRAGSLREPWRGSRAVPSSAMDLPFWIWFSKNGLPEVPLLSEHLQSLVEFSEQVFAEESHPGFRGLLTLLFEDITFFSEYWATKSTVHLKMLQMAASHRVCTSAIFPLSRVST